MRLEDHFGNGSMLQRNERKLAASFWNNIGAGIVIGGMAAAFFLDKPQGAWTKMGIAIAGLLVGWLCYSIASNMLTYMHYNARRAPLGRRYWSDLCVRRPPFQTDAPSVRLDCPL